MSTNKVPSTYCSILMLVVENPTPMPQRYPYLLPYGDTVVAVAFSFCSVLTLRSIQTSGWSDAVNPFDSNSLVTACRIIFRINSPTGNSSASLVIAYVSFAAKHAALAHY